MKKNFVFKTFLASLFVAFSLASCNQISDSALVSTSKNNVKVSLAIPSEIENALGFENDLENNFSARSAIPNVASVKYELKLTAPGKTPKTLTSDTKSFEFDLENGNWTFTVSVFEKTAYETNPSTAIPFLKGEKTVTVASSVLESVEIALSLNTSQKGSVDLGVYWDAPEISKCNYKIGTSISGTLSFSGKIAENDVAPGFYDAELLFFNSSNELLYSIHSKVGVFAGLKTTKWLGETEYDSAKGGINITDSLLKSFQSSTIFVNASHSGNESGSYYEPFKSIQKAIDRIQKINDGTTEYKIYLTGDFKAESGSPLINFDSFAAPVNVSIKPVSGTSKLEGNGSQVVKIDNKNAKISATLENLTITKGEYGGSGAGVRVLNGAAVTLKNCVITKNKATGGNGSGAGIYIANGDSGGTSCAIIDCEITENEASQNGGGIGSSASKGDGAYPLAYIKNTIVKNNTASGGGGGISLNSGSYFGIVDCTDISGNKVTGGGNGNGINATGNLLLFGNTVIDSGNDVYVGSAISLGDDFSGRAKLTPSTYSETTQVIKGDATAIGDNYKNFTVTDEVVGGNIVSWIVGSNGYLVKNTALLTVYVDQASGSDSNSGEDSSHPVKSLTKALTLVDVEGTTPVIILMSPYYLSASESNVLNLSSGSSLILQRYAESDWTKNLFYIDSAPDASLSPLAATTDPLTIKNVTFDGNKTNANNVTTSSLLLMNKVNVTLENVTLKDNKNVDTFVYLPKTCRGGAIFMQESTLTLKDASITGNEASSDGAGIYASNATIVLNDATISGNTSSGNGNGIWGDHLEIELSGTLNLGTSDDVHFEDECNIKIIKDDFDFKEASSPATATQLKISLKEYTVDKKVFYGDTGIAITDAICKKFTLGNSDYELVPANLSGGIYTEGIIKSTETVTVADVTEFKSFIDRVNAGENYISIKLDSDIDLSSASESFVIGQTESDPYNGTFDGQGHTVTVSLNSMKFQRSSTADFDYAGLVGILGEKGIIENVTIKSNETLTIDVNNQNGFASGICLFNNGVIRNCVNNASIWKKTFWDVGGICAVNKGLIENCLNTGDITIKWSIGSPWGGVYARLGGIAAENKMDSSVIKNCANLGKIFTEYAYQTSDDINGCPGAIAGLFNNANSKIENCYWLENCVTKGTTTNSNVSWNGLFKSLLGSVTGCGTFTSITSITSGSAADCGTVQTLASYASGKGLVDAMNGWINAQSTPSIYRRWTADDFTKPHVSSDGIEITIEGSGGYTFELSPATPTFGGTVTLAVKKSGSAVTAVSTTMQLIQGGDFENPVSTSTTGSLTIPSWLSVAGTNFKLYITATIGGTTYDKIVDITVSQ